MVYDVFFILGAVLILGFITSKIFERTKFPDVILLMMGNFHNFNNSKNTWGKGSHKV